LIFVTPTPRYLKYFKERRGIEQFGNWVYFIVCYIDGTGTGVIPSQFINE